MATITAEQAFALACGHYRSSRYSEAESLCRQILRATPDHRDTLMLLAVLAHRGGRTVEGDGFLDQAVESGNFSITLDASVDAKPRWSPHAGISALLEADCGRYDGVLRSFWDFLPWLRQIACDSDPQQPAQPHWKNAWMPVLDAAALYCLVAQKRPRYFVEIGSGNSTKFVARAIADHRLDTRIVSIDPRPRAEIDELCDEVVRRPLEQCDLELFGSLGKNDIVFADSSHRSFMNSDVTVFFCEILPALAGGVVVGIHDIFLPYDYPEPWSGRYYSEQYLLACYLLARSPLLRVVLPVHFMLRRAAGSDAVQAFCAELPGAPQPEGGSFWLERI